jgi:hypothetical protein
VEGLGIIAFDQLMDALGGVEPPYVLSEIDQTVFEVLT